VIFKDVPFPSEVLPQETEYHCHDALVPSVPPISVSVTAVPEHTDNEGLPVTEVGITDNELTMIEVEKHPVVLQVPSALT
jgi:hypothetical protein